jgi:hypothetical protein
MTDEITGEIVQAPPAADMRYTDDTAVARVFVRVDYADGRIREYEAREPQGFKLNEGMAAREASFAISAGGLFRAPTMMSAALSLSFGAHPRWNLHIRTEATAPEEFTCGIPTAQPAKRPRPAAARELPAGDAPRSTPTVVQDCDVMTDKCGEQWKYDEPGDVWCLVDNHLGPGSVNVRSARSWQRLQAEFGPLTLHG